MNIHTKLNIRNKIYLLRNKFHFIYFLIKQLRQNLFYFNRIKVSTIKALVRNNSEK